jgi:predicted CoA-binding protein
MRELIEELQGVRIDHGRLCGLGAESREKIKLCHPCPRQETGTLPLHRLRFYGPRMDHETYSDTYIRGILNTAKTIAMVGISPKENRPSYFAFKYLLERGYRMIPVNPGQAGKNILGQKVYAKLSDIPEPVDMVDIFRASEHALAVVQEALALKSKPGVIWMQLGVRNDAAAKLAEAAGLKVVMNRCPKIEYGRLSSEISWMGVNSRTLSAKRPRTLGTGVQRMRLGPASDNDNGG